MDLAGDANELKFPYSKKAMSSGKNYFSSFNFISIVKWGKILFKMGKGPQSFQSNRKLICTVAHLFFISILFACTGLQKLNKSIKQHNIH